VRVIEDRVSSLSGY